MQPLCQYCLPNMVTIASRMSNFAIGEKPELSLRCVQVNQTSSCTQKDIESDDCYLVNKDNVEKR